MSSFKNYEESEIEADSTEAQLSNLYMFLEKVSRACVKKTYWEMEAEKN